MSFTLNSTQQSIVNNLIALQNAPYTATSVEEFGAAFDAFMEDEINFTFDECEEISMFHGWA